MNTVLVIKHNNDDEFIDEIACMVPVITVGDYLLVPGDCEEDLEGIEFTRKEIDL